MKDKTLYGGNLIYTTQDAWGPVEIVDIKDTRSLFFGSTAVQSSMSLQNPYSLPLQYSKLFMFSLLFNPSPKSALILGLGGGSVAKFLWKYVPECQIHAVENRQAVVDVCYEYFYLPRSKRLTIHAEDAFRFMQKSSMPQYDIIFVDLFLGDGMPKEVGHSAFFKACASQLNTPGILAWNTWRSAPHDLMVKSIDGLCEAFGKNILILPSITGGNNVFLVFKGLLPRITREQLRERASDWTVKTGVDFSGLLSTLHDLAEYAYPFL